MKSVPTLLLLALVALASACKPSGGAAGAPCQNAFDCSSRLCLARSTGAVCVDACSSTSECHVGDVCGVYNFGGVDPESGTFDDAGDEVLHVCRERFNAVCTATAPCTFPGQTCLTNGGAASGVCVASCAADTGCASGLCVGASASQCGGHAGACAPLCDDTVECPSGWYCNLVGAPRAGHGRCDPVTPVATDAAVCTDASNDL